MATEATVGSNRRASGIGAAVIDLAAIATALVAIFFNSVGAYELLLILLLARPMWDFVRVLRDIGSS